MARQFDDVQLEYLTVPTPVLTASAPIAMCCWFKSDDVSNGYCLMSICDSAGNADNIALYAQGAVGGDPVRFQMSDVGGWDIADTTAGYTANTWHHACGISVNITDRRVLLDGGNKGTDVGNCFPTGLDNTNIGLMKRLALTGYMSGAIAEACIIHIGYYPGASIFDKADYFETNVLPSLAAGFSPLFYPWGLMAYWPLLNVNTGGEDTDIVGGYDMTPVNTPTFTDHPRIFMPTRSQLTTPRGVIPAYGKLKNEPILTGLMKIQPALTGVIKNETILTGKFKNYTGV